VIDSHAHDWGNSSTEVLIGLRGSTLKTVHYSTKSCCLGKRWKSCRLRDVFPSDGNRNWSLLLVAVLGASWWVTGWLCLDLLWISSLGLGLSDLNAADDSDVHVVHYYSSICVSRAEVKRTRFFYFRLPRTLTMSNSTALLISLINWGMGHLWVHLGF